MKTAKPELVVVQREQVDQRTGGNRRQSVLGGQTALEVQDRCNVTTSKAFYGVSFFVACSSHRQAIAHAISHGSPRIPNVAVVPKSMKRPERQS
jgi:hypothetical protein